MFVFGFASHVWPQVLDKYEDLKLGELHGIDAKKVGSGPKEDVERRRFRGGGNVWARAWSMRWAAAK